MQKTKSRVVINSKIFPQWFLEGIKDLGWSLLGNTLPLWVILLLTCLNQGFSLNSLYTALHQPWTILILSGTYLTTTFYIVSKNRMDSGLFKILYTVLLLTIGVLISMKDSLEDLSAATHVEVSVVVVFVVCFVIYLIFLFKSHHKRLNPDYAAASKTEKEKLDKDFDETS